MVKWNSNLVGGGQTELPAGVPEVWAQRLPENIGSM